MTGPPEALELPVASAVASRYRRLVMADNRTDHQQYTRASKARYCAAAFLLLCSISVSGCGAGGVVFGDYDLPETADVTDADWPRLVDAPEAVAPGVYTDAAPNPVVGLVMVETLTAEAEAAARRAEELGKPVLTEAEARRLRLAAR